MKPIWYFLFGVWTVAGGMWLMVSWPFLASSVRRRFRGDRRPELVVILRKLDKAQQRIAKVEAALSRWWAMGTRAFWRFAHRNGCNGANANDWEVARRELISTEVSPLTDKIAMHFPSSATACSQATLWQITQWDFRMRCRKCGRVHQRTMNHYQPL
jgi:hypothetical protein